jgi:hypothetical protein
MSAVEIHRKLCAVYRQNITKNELYDNDFECSKMGEQMSMMKSEVVGHL